MKNYLLQHVFSINMFVCIQINMHIEFGLSSTHFEFNSLLTDEIL